MTSSFVIAAHKSGSILPLISASCCNKLKGHLQKIMLHPDKCQRAALISLQYCCRPDALQEWKILLHVTMSQVNVLMPYTSALTADFMAFACLMVNSRIDGSIFELAEAFCWSPGTCWQSQRRKSHQNFPVTSSVTQAPSRAMRFMKMRLHCDLVCRSILL